MSDRPLLDIADEADRAAAERLRERAARNALIRERILQSQAAAEMLGIRRGSTAWLLIGLTAKIAGWEMLKTTKRELAEDADVGCSLSALKYAIARLEASGLVKRYALAATTYTGKAESIGVALQLDRVRIQSLADEARGGSQVRERQSYTIEVQRIPPEECQEQACIEAPQVEFDRVVDPVKDRVKEGVKDPVKDPVKEGVKVAKHSLYAFLDSQSPNLPPPQEASPRAVPLGVVVCAFGDLGVGQASLLVRRAIARGCTPRELLAIARWFVRSQRLNPHRWRKPASALLARLHAAEPGLPAWKGWIPGESPRRRVRRPDPAAFLARRQQARRIASDGPTMAEMLAAGRSRLSCSAPSHQEVHA